MSCIAVLALVGVGSVWAVRTLLAVTTTRRLPMVSEVWRRSILVSVVAIVATVLWGRSPATPSGPVGCPPGSPRSTRRGANRSRSLPFGAGAFFAIAPAWFLARRKAPLEADVYVGTLVLLVAGAPGWGARLGDFNMFHVFFGGISVFATPVAAVAVISVARHLRTTRHPTLADRIRRVLRDPARVGCCLAASCACRDSGQTTTARCPSACWRQSGSCLPTPS